MSQRWRHGRHSFVGGVIDPRDYEVADITEALARDFVLAHHYSSTYPAAVRRYGLMRRDVLVGVAVYSHPVNKKTFRDLPGPQGTHVELGRLVLLDEVPQNGESYFVGRTHELLRRDRDREFTGVVSFSDPVPRRALDGRVILPGHVGYVYQATNAVYVGRGHGEPIALLPDAQVLNRRTQQKIRKREKGWRPACDLLVGFGADAPPDDDAERCRWLSRWKSKLCRRLPHAGNHKYLWALDRRLRAELPAGRPYPKEIDPDAPS